MYDNDVMRHSVVKILKVKGGVRYQAKSKPRKGWFKNIRTKRGAERESYQQAYDDLMYKRF